MSSHPPPPPDPEPMALDNPTPINVEPLPPTKKTLTLTTATLKSPPFAYAHLALAQAQTQPPPSSTTTTTTSSSSSSSPLSPSPPPLDALQVRAYLTSALRQFLGATGAGMPVDILLVTADAAWVRVPHADLAAFAAGVTAFAGVPLSSSPSSGVVDGGEVGRGMLQLQVRACGDWLGSLIGREEQAGLWRC